MPKKGKGKGRKSRSESPARKISSSSSSSISKSRSGRSDKSISGSSDKKANLLTEYKSWKLKTKMRDTIPEKTKKSGRPRKEEYPEHVTVDSFLQGLGEKYRPTREIFFINMFCKQNFENFDEKLKAYQHHKRNIRHQGQQQQYGGPQGSVYNGQDSLAHTDGLPDEFVKCVGDKRGSIFGLILGRWMYEQEKKYPQYAYYPADDVISPREQEEFNYFIGLGDTKFKTIRAWYEWYMNYERYGGKKRKKTAKRKSDKRSKRSKRRFTKRR